MVQKTAREKHDQSVAPPPGLALPPGLSAPSSLSRKKAIRRLVGDELAAAGFPPGLAMPPGLALPPGLETIAEDVATSDSTTAGESTPASPAESSESEESSEEKHQVQLSGLPIDILSDIMFRAVLQQAQLNGHYSKFTTSPGKPLGKAVVTLVSQSAADWCICHFHGRVWADGVPVNAHLLAKRGAPEATSADISPEEPWLEAWFQEACSLEGLGDFGKEELGEVWFPEAVEQYPPAKQDQRPSSSFSAEAPAFALGSSLPGGLSAKAPAFVPGKKSMAPDQRVTNSSDVSTVDGESESDEEKVVVIEVAAC